MSCCSGAMDLSASAAVVALLHWPHLLLLPVSSSTSSLSNLPLLPLTPFLATSRLRPSLCDSAPPTTWQGRKGRRSVAPWTSSAWRASSREERAVCWWSTAGRFLSTTRPTCKVLSMSAALSWWRGDCSKTKCPSLSCCNPTARWRWVQAQTWWFLFFGWLDVSD